MDEKAFDKIFKNPPAQYRGAPFWAWNGDLKPEYLTEQIDFFKKMGFGGAHMHTRTGLTDEYLGEKFMDCIKICTQKFKKEKMLSYLYDEDRYPSGFAGGIVTKNIKNRERYLMMSVEKRENDKFRKLLAVYDVVQNGEGYLEKYERISENTEAKGTKWYAYLEINRGSESWFNGECYTDMLSKRAMRDFLDSTYEKYKEAVGKEFGKTIPAIFSDEPNFVAKQFPKLSTDKNDMRYPWTDVLAERYKKAYGDDILDHIPEVFWELPDEKVSAARYRLHDLITTLFTEALSVLGKWCDKNGILFECHLLSEPNLEQQTASNGECMRPYSVFSVPGVDILRGDHEYQTLKQCQSVVRQYGKAGMMSELYGVTNWDYDFRGHKHQGDWQAAFGVTTRIHHLSWYSMEGEAKRDYPASISYQSPWYEKYSYIEDHFARINAAMKRGRPVVRIGVIHPIETTWLHFGANDKTADKKRALQENFENTVKWLIFGSFDFDFICESTLPDICKRADAPLCVGKMKYDVIIVPGCETLRSTTLERLEAFRENGGRLIFMGDAPTLCDALVSERGKNLYDISEKIGFSKLALYDRLKDCREVYLGRPDGTPTGNLVYQLREEKDGTKWLFIANAVAYTNIDIPTSQNVTVRISGIYTPKLYDTLTGKTEKIPYRIENGRTVIERTFFNHDSLLLKLSCYDGKKYAKKSVQFDTFPVKLPRSFEYSLSEPNVLVLDLARFSLNGSPYSEDEEEILRIDTVCREKLGFNKIKGLSVQPYISPEKEIRDYVGLYFEISSEICAKNVSLAIEHADKVKIKLNGKEIKNKPGGYFGDRFIKTLPLGDIVPGVNTLEVTCPIGIRTSLERMFLLGDFGVSSIGRTTKITKAPEKICFDDIRYQGLPFYGANITYKCPVTTEKDGVLSIHCPVYRGALISVMLDGRDVGNIVFSPYTLDIPKVSAGSHLIELTLYGTRMNTFGQIHCHHHSAIWRYGPQSFRTRGDEWYYEYETKPQGIQRTPVITIKTEKEK